MREIHWNLHEVGWTDWARTELGPEERENIRAALSTDQQQRLADDHYVWVAGVGILWTPPDRALRRARFTHGFHFDTENGEFYVDSAGNTRRMTGMRPRVRPSDASPLSPANGIAKPSHRSMAH
jgi:hypothetical protein